VIASPHEDTSNAGLEEERADRRSDRASADYDDSGRLGRSWVNHS
jgi:hypothetical protein